MHFTANDEISLKTNGSTRLQVTNSGIDVTGAITVNGAALGGSANCTPSFVARFSSNVAFTSNSVTKVPFDSEEFDTDSAFDTSNHRFTVPSGKGGKYFFYVQFMVPNLDSGKILELEFYKNGSRYGHGLVNREESGSGASFVTIVVNAIIELSAGDYMEAFAYHNEGNNQTVQTNYNRFGGFRFGT